MKKTATEKILTYQGKIGDILKKSAPIFAIIGGLANIVYPYILRIQILVLYLWEISQPYHPEELLPLLFGLVLAFFGGHFFTLFAAIEAYRLCGYDQTKRHIDLLYENYLKFRKANDDDNSKDDNEDGIPDVHQISSQELLTRKLSLIMETMDPVGLSEALSGIWMGFLGVVAVLRTKFAQTVALGATVGQILESFVGERILKPILERAIPNQHHKWIPIVVSYSCKAVGVSIAWTIQRVISAFYSSIRGANMFTLGLSLYLAKRGGSFASISSSIGNEENKTPLFFVITAIVAWCGFVWQLKSGFSLPFPLNVLFCPLTIAEYFITWFVAVETQ